MHSLETSAPFASRQPRFRRATDIDLERADFDRDLVRQLDSRAAQPRSQSLLLPTRSVATAVTLEIEHAQAGFSYRARYLQRLGSPVAVREGALLRVTLALRWGQPIRCVEHTLRVAQGMRDVMLPSKIEVALLGQGLCERAEIESSSPVVAVHCRAESSSMDSWVEAAE